MEVRVLMTMMLIGLYRKEKAPPTYLVLLRINSSPEEGCFPAVHIFLRITGQFYLKKIFVHIPTREIGVLVNV